MNCKLNFDLNDSMRYSSIKQKEIKGMIKMGCSTVLLAFFPVVVTLVVMTLEGEQVTESTIPFMFTIEVLWGIGLFCLSSMLLGSKEETKEPDKKEAVDEREYDANAAAEISKTIKMSNEQNQTLTEEYRSIKVLRLRKAEEIGKKKENLNEIDKCINELVKEKDEILLAKKKPILMTKKKYLTLHQNEVEIIEKELEEKIRSKNHLGEEIQELEESILSGKFKIGDVKKNFAGNLARAFAEVRSACYVEGEPSIKDWIVTANQMSKDLADIDYEENPFAMDLYNNRFYFFSNGIIVYAEKDELLGVFDLKCLKCELISTKKPYREWKKEPDIYPDTKIVEEDVQHYTWLHTCKDGTPDLRYKNNPRRYYTIKEKFYLTCVLKLEICGYELEYRVSSFDTCKQLEEIITGIKENTNGVK